MTAETSMYRCLAPDASVSVLSLLTWSAVTFCFSPLFDLYIYFYRDETQYIPKYQGWIYTIAVGGSSSREAYASPTANVPF